MTSLYLIGLGLGLFVIVFSTLLLIYGFKANNNLVRLGLICCYCLYTIAIVLISSHILNVTYYEIVDKSTKTLFFLLWIVPYTVTTIWWVAHYGKRRK